MSVLIVNVHGTPRGKSRPRFVKGKVVTTTKPKEKLWRKAVERAAFAAAVGRGEPMPLFTGPVRIHMLFTFEPPASARDRIGQPHTQKPDKDNIEKLVLDALVKMKVLRDDAQVAGGDVRKLWGERAGVAIRVEQIDAAPAQAPTRAAGSEPPGWLTGSR